MVSLIHLSGGALLPEQPRKTITRGNSLMAKEKKLQPPQRQERQPGREHKMKPRPKAAAEKHRGSGKLRDKAAIITGGDSGIGRAVAIVCPAVRIELVEMSERL